MIVKGDGKDFKSVEPGTYVARCIKVIDLGTQHGEYKGKPVARRQVLITWELPTELIEDGEFKGQPYAVSKFYTAYLGEKAHLRKDLESWRGKAFTQDELDGFNLSALLDKPCMVSVIKSDTGKTKVNNVTSIPKGLTVPERVNMLTEFSLDHFDITTLEAISQGIRSIIEKSDEYQAMFNSDPTIESGDVSF